MKVPYMFRGQLWYANKAPTDSPVGAVCRALHRRLGAPVSLWWTDREGGEAYTVKWYDAKTETYQESRVVLS